MDQKPRFIRRNGRIIPIFSKKQKEGGKKIAGGTGAIAGSATIASGILQVSRLKNFKARNEFSTASNFKKAADMITRSTIQTGRIGEGAKKIASYTKIAREATISGNKLRSQAKFFKRGAIGVAALGFVAGASRIDSGVDMLLDKKVKSPETRSSIAIGATAGLSYGLTRNKSIAKITGRLAKKYR